MTIPLRTHKDLDECLERIRQQQIMQAERERGVWFVRFAAWIAGVMVMTLVLILLRASGVA